VYPYFSIGAANRFCHFVVITRLPRVAVLVITSRREILLKKSETLIGRNFFLVARPRFELGPQGYENKLPLFMLLTASNYVGIFIVLTVLIG
jgi:hypothetical protein